MSTRAAPVAPAPAATTELSRGLLAAAVAVTAWGASSVIAKVLPQGALAIAAYRFMTYFVVISIWRATRRQYLSWGAFKKSIPGGLLLAADVAFFFTAIKLTTVVNATIIGALQPLILTAYGVRFLGERLRRADMILGLVALAGVVVIVLAGSNSGDANIWGDLAAVGALASWSAYFVFAKRADGVVSPTDYTLAAALIVALANAPLALAFGQSLAWPAWSDWLWLIGMALGAGLLGHNMMNWSIVRIPLWLGSTMTLLVPLVSSAIAWIFLDEPLNPTQIIAMVVALAAIGKLVRAQSAPRPDSTIS
ncbi:MAG: EamA family transporter [Acidimicrobiaceae bacterium]|nr:EamA family transporter [Acidimicrobiaceae bacterium]MCO4832774.1 EamA family transporter [Acidimicrobiaceae bacterium]MDB4205904.1 DMT family transporter [bacterium]MDC1390288.1 DMT family transporter [Acidimicrobiales bacterium]